MKFYQLIFVLSILLVFSYTASSQTASHAIALNDLSAFRNPVKNWSVAADATADFTKPGDLKPVAGTGAVVNIVSKENNAHLVTKDEMSDVDLELDFMMAKNSNSGVYLQGRYEIQLFDSWTKRGTSYSDAGGIYQRWDESRAGEKGYEGIAPATNVARAPGLWQHLRIVFRAPRFNEQGQKTVNARFEEVYLNGVLVQQQAEVTGPTRSAIFTDEKPTGPLMLQGDHGNVAFRNIHYRLPDTTGQPKNTAFENPILLNADSKPYLLRSFLMFGNKKLTHVISAGNPNHVNYSYDLKQGSLLQIWRGQFLDVTDMWYERGEPQIAKPTGSVVTLSDAPAIAVLADANAAWPDSAAFDDLNNKGYVLDKDRSPTFRYEIKGITVSDKVTTSANDEGITRAITVNKVPANTYARIAVANNVQDAGDGLFTLDKNYYIRIDKGLKPLLRQTAQGTELLLPFNSQNATVTYSIIW